MRAAADRVAVDDELVAQVRRAADRTERHGRLQGRCCGGRIWMAREILGISVRTAALRRGSRRC